METPLHHLVNLIVTYLLKNKKKYTIFWFGVLDSSAYHFDERGFFVIKLEEHERIVLANKILNHVLKITQNLHSYILTSDVSKIKHFFPSRKVVELISNFLNIPIYYDAQRGEEEAKFFRLDSCILCPPLRIQWDEKSHKYAFRDDKIEVDNTTASAISIQAIANEELNSSPPFDFGTGELKPPSSLDFRDIEIKPSLSFDFGEQTNIYALGGSNKLPNQTDDEKIFSRAYLAPKPPSSSTPLHLKPLPNMPDAHALAHLFCENEQKRDPTHKSLDPSHLLENQTNRGASKDPNFTVTPILENFTEIPHRGKLFEIEKAEIKDLFKIYKEILIRLNDNAGIHEKNIGILTNEYVDLKCGGCPIHCSPAILANTKAKRGPKSGSIKSQNTKSDSTKKQKIC